MRRVLGTSVRRVGVIGAAGAMGASLLLVGPAAGSPHHSAPRTGSASTITWGKCPASYSDLKGTSVKCAALKVPLDYSNPGGQQISIEVSLLRHTSSAKNYKGYLLTNPGGPGGPGLDLPRYIASLVPNHVGGDFDWIGFDPRGVGASKPALRCDRNYFHGDRPPYDPTSKRILNYWVRQSKHYAAACAKAQPALIQHMTTEDSARDMDAIRKALGVARISYYGFSYGTYLGQVYGTLFPSHLRRMVLDSNVDPRRVWYGANLDQDIAFDRNIKIYFRWVARYHKVYGLGSTEKQVSRNFYAEQRKLDRHPVGPIGGDEFNDVVLYAGYYTPTWTDIASAWKALVHGRVGPMRSQYRGDDEPGDDNGFAVYNAVQCGDAHWPGLTKTLRDMRRTAKRAPFETWSNAWYNAPCIYWHAKPRRPLKINGSKVPSALLIDETLDAATPYPGSLETRRLIRHSSLIAEPGGTNHAFTLSGDACVDNRIASYLATGRRPARQNWNGADYVCKPLPQPKPPTNSAKSSAAAPAAQPATLLPLRLALHRFR